MIDALNAVGASDVLRPSGQASGAAVAAAPGDSFGAMFANVVSQARDTMRAGEAAAIAGVSGETSVQNVVRAMMDAEQQLKAAVAVRDRVVAAYQEVSRMQI